MIQSKNRAIHLNFEWDMENYCLAVCAQYHDWICAFYKQNDMILSPDLYCTSTTACWMMLLGPRIISIRLLFLTGRRLEVGVLYGMV